MGVAQSLLSGLDASPSQHSSENKNSGSLQHQQRQSADLGLSWDSGKLHRDMLAKYSELELLSLRQVFQQLKEKQDKITVKSTAADGEHPAGTEDGQGASTSSTPAAAIPEQTQPTKKKMMESKKVVPPSPPPGITEAVFEVRAATAFAENQGSCGHANQTEETKNEANVRAVCMCPTIF